MYIQPPSNSPNIFNFSPIDLAELIEAQSKISYRPTPFDPRSIAALLDEQWAAWPALAEALRRCTTQWVADAQFAYLVDQASPEAEAELPHKATLLVHCPERGEIRLNILINGSIAELQFMDFYEPMSRTTSIAEELDPMPPFTVVYRRWKHGAEG